MTSKAKNKDRLQPYTIRIPEALHRDLKIKAATEGRSMNDIVEGLISAYVKGKGKGK
jgi:predicted HicB family RNase H-like nuclease